jgi:hypothetical protein
MTEHEQNLRDLAAMFAMAGLLARGDDASIINKAFDLANEFMHVRNPAQDGGIADITPKKKYGRKTVD